jgi:hypothetical protein
VGREVEEGIGREEEEGGEVGEEKCVREEWSGSGRG